jgi:hypothetical protein
MVMVMVFRARAALARGAHPAEPVAAQRAVLAVAESGWCAFPH